MTVFNTPEFKVGLLVLVVSALIAVMSLKVSEDPSFLGRSKAVSFLIDDASGLVKGSNVKMAGIDVGIIRDIRLENGRARVEMIIRDEIPLTTSSRIEIRPSGILGDKNVEIVPGDPRDPPLRSGEQILIVDDRASVDKLIGEISKISKSVSDVVDNIKEATEGDADKPLGRIINNLETITGDIAELTRDRKGEVGEIIGSVRNVTRTLDELINDTSENGFRQRWGDALSSLKRIETTLQNVEEITDKINRGEGTIGRLVNDETTVEELNTAIAGVNQFIDAGSKLSTSIDFHTQYMTESGLTKSYLGLKIQPGLDRYYELAVVDDPRGVVETTEITTTTGAGATEVTEQKRYFHKVKFTALFAKNFYDWTLKGGVIENSGGVALDYHMFRRRLRLSLEGYDFSDFNGRFTARYNVLNGIYILGGLHDFADSENRSAFVGGGIFLTNDDLKLLLSRMPF